MLQTLLQGFFTRFSADAFSVPKNEALHANTCTPAANEVVDHVVGEISSRLRSVPGYVRKLAEPVSKAFRYIDQIAEDVPGPYLCCRSTFSENPQVNSFFISPKHLQEVFSQSAEIRQLFDENPFAEECWALLCLRREERHQLGMALVNGDLRKDVIQTAVSFTDHQLVSPGFDEASARCALKCCMFNGVLRFIRNKSIDARTRVSDMENRLRILHARMRSQKKRRDKLDAVNNLATEIRVLEKKLATEDLHLTTIGDQMDFVIHALSNPAHYLSAQRSSVRINRLAIKLEKSTEEPCFDLDLTEISIASHRPRVSALVRFPRNELLPKPDFVKQAGMFLGV